MGMKSNIRSFGISDYKAMAKSRGLRLPWVYFFENHLFDLRFSTDTHKWLPIDEYDYEIMNLRHGVLYMASWTSVVLKSTRIALELLENDSGDFEIVDVGSGKGKTLLVWSKLMKLSDRKMYGIEYSKELIAICENNLKDMSVSNITLLNADASKIDASLFGEKLLLYLYNPFDESILKEFLAKLQSKSIVLIYNNPVHSHVLVELGYESFFIHDSWHPSGRFTIFKSSGYLC